MLTLLLTFLPLTETKWQRRGWHKEKIEDEGRGKVQREKMNKKLMKAS